MPQFGQIGCFVKLKGSRNKHKVILDEHIGSCFPNRVTVIELCSGEKTDTTWKNISAWGLKNLNQNQNTMDIIAKSNNMKKQILSELKREQTELEKILLDNKCKQQELIISEFTKKYGIGIGDLIAWHDAVGNKNYTGKVTELLCPDEFGFYISVLGDANKSLFIYSDFDKIKVIQKNETNAKE